MFNLLPGHGLGFPDNAAVISLGLGHVLFEIIIEEEEVPRFQQGFYGPPLEVRRAIVFRIAFGDEVYEAKFIFELEDDGEVNAALIPVRVTAGRDVN